MAEVHHFEFGFVSPFLAVSSAIAGCLLGIILTIKAQKVMGSRRVRLLMYASVAIGVTAVWQAHVLALLGLGTPDLMLRLDPRLLAVSVGLALLPAGTALFLVSYGRVRRGRLLTAGALLSLAIVGTQFLILNSVRVGGVVTYDLGLQALSYGIGLVTAGVLLRFVTATRGLRPSIAAAVVCGLGLSAVHYCGEFALTIHIGQAIDGPIEVFTGISPMMVALPTMVFGGVMTSMMWFFSVGTATKRDLHSIFVPSDHSGQIEPWMIEEISARMKLNGPTQNDNLPHFTIPSLTGRRPPGQRPAPGIVPVWRTASIWGATDNAASPTPVRAKDRNTRQPPDVSTSKDRTAAIRRVSTVHRDPPPTSGVAPVSPAPGTAPQRQQPPVGTLTGAHRDTGGRPEASTSRWRNRRRH